jgi:asparagine synthase (glutamine-hydrolyzing)
MCGIVGIWGPLHHKRSLIASSCAVMRHRGPDSEGIWEDADSGLAMGHVRLAIIDVSPAGHQPMESACGRYVIVLNGEIYNHLELRATLEKQDKAPSWRGHSDTETLLACFVAWGVEATLKAAIGMFAIALWDKQEQHLTLVRDRMGEKPLYAGFVGDTFVFASELKALADIPGLDRRPDPRALSMLMRHNYIPAPWSIYQQIRKVSPGGWMQLTAAERRLGELPVTRSYWSAAITAKEGATHPLSFEKDEDAVDALESTLEAAVKRQMIADVPLGAFLSGGVDSSTIVALMQKHSDRPVQTFSIGFDDPRFNEAQHAAAVAAHLGTNHAEHYVSDADALNLVPGLAQIYDEPFADSSQIPTILVTRMARQHVTVALSGDGGDELFTGYGRYFRAAEWWQRRAKVPAPLRTPAALSAKQLSALLPGGRHRDRLSKLAQVLGAPHVGAFYREFVSYWARPAEVLLHADTPPDVFDERPEHDFFAAISLLDIQTYLPDDILVKVDRAAMATSLETRVPLLDHHVYALARQLPTRYHVRDGQGKWLLRQVLYRHVPRELIERPKKGFSVPLDQWLRGPLADWAHALLAPSRLRSEQLFREPIVTQKWQEHLSGRRDWSKHLWSILMVQAWSDASKSRT